MEENDQMETGISIREKQVERWLDRSKFKGEYLLVSTKPDSIYSKRLAGLHLRQRLVVDLYTPIFLEKELTLSKWKLQDLLTRWRNKKMVQRFLRRGNHFLVANRRQREYWLETAGGLGVPLRANDISVFPTGAGYEPRATSHEPRARQPEVVLWFGGIYPWMDPQPLIRAFAELAGEYPDWKLRVLGGFHPQTGYINRYQQIKKLSQSIIPKNQIEIFDWQNQEDLGKYLQDVSVAIHLVKSDKEDRLSHRVRLLTLLNNGIPIVTSGKDTISDLLVNMKAGIRINEEDQKGVLKQVMSNSIEHFRWVAKTKKVQEKFIENEMDIRIGGLIKSQSTL